MRFVSELLDFGNPMPFDLKTECRRIFTLEQMHGAALNYARTCRVGALSRGVIIRLHVGIE